MDLKIYIDGACIGNPGPGGWPVIVINNNTQPILFIK